MLDSKETVIVYQKQVDICKQYLTPEQFGRLMFALFDPNSPVDDDIALAYAFMSLQREVDREKYEKRCEQNRENGKKGGRPKTEKTERLFSKPNGFFQNPNDNDNDNEDDNDNASGSDDIPSLLSYLNSETGSSYSDTEQIRELIKAKLDDGYTADDIRNVIHKKSIEWNCDGKMRRYLRPSTLFGDKFDEYLNAPDPVEVEEERTAAEEHKQLLHQLSDKENELEQISERIDVIRNGGDESVKANYDELNELKLMQAITEQDIDSLKRRTGAAT